MTDLHADPPCRICGARREPHGLMPVDHRYRAERYCAIDTCERVATWYVNGDPLCSYHKGKFARADRIGPQERVERIRKD